MLHMWNHSQRSDIIICQIDKNPGFYIGDAVTIELKAYKEISDCHSR